MIKTIRVSSVVLYRINVVTTKWHLASKYKSHIKIYAKAYFNILLLRRIALLHISLCVLMHL